MKQIDNHQIMLDGVLDLDVMELKLFMNGILNHVLLKILPNVVKIQMELILDNVFLAQGGGIVEVLKEILCFVGVNLPLLVLLRVPMIIY